MSWDCGAQPATRMETGQECETEPSLACGGCNDPSMHCDDCAHETKTL